MRHVLVPIALLGLRGDDIAYRVAPGTTLVRTWTKSCELVLESEQHFVDGEEVAEELPDGLEARIRCDEKLVVTDVVEEAGPGRPARVRRTFDELGRTEDSSYSYASYESGEGERESGEELHEYGSELEEKCVVFTWNDDAASFDVEHAERGGGEVLLDGLEEDMDLRALLPSGPVSVGDSWELEADALRSVLYPGGVLGLQDLREGASDTSALDAQLRENLAGTFSATYAGLEEGRAFATARILLEIQASTSGEEDLHFDDKSNSGSQSSTFGFQLEGVLLWDLEHGHAAALDLSGRHEAGSRVKLTYTHNGESIEDEDVLTFRGEATFSMRCERR